MRRSKKSLLQNKNSERQLFTKDVTKKPPNSFAKATI